MFLLNPFSPSKRGIEFGFNTSHVLIKPMALWTLLLLGCCFNTSHVLIKLKKDHQTYDGPVSIHLMFLLNIRKWICSCRKNGVSIHLMFLLNSPDTYCPDVYESFNTSHVLIKLLQYFLNCSRVPCFNTSHVLIKRNYVIIAPCFAPFQYISCSY